MTLGPFFWTYTPERSPKLLNGMDAYAPPNRAGMYTVRVTCQKKYLGEYFSSYFYFTLFFFRGVSSLCRQSIKIVQRISVRTYQPAWRQLQLAYPTWWPARGSYWTGSWKYSDNHLKLSTSTYGSALKHLFRVFQLKVFSEPDYRVRTQYACALDKIFPEGIKILQNSIYL